MRRLFLSLLTIVLFTIFWGEPGFCVTEPENDEVLTVIISANNPPYAFMQYGSIVGFDIDLAKMICNRLGRKFQFKNVPQNQVLPAIKNKEGDMAIAGVNASESKEFGLDFSIPYLTNTKALVMVNSGEFLNVPQGAYFPCWMLQDRTIGVVSGSQIESELYDLGIKNLTIRRYENVGKLLAEMTKRVRHKKILYGIVVSIQDAQSMVKQNEDLIFYRLKLRNSLVTAFPKGSPIRAEVNDIITNLVNEGKIYGLESKWEISGE